MLINTVASQPTNNKKRKIKINIMFMPMEENEVTI